MKIDWIPFWLRNRWGLLAALCTLLVGIYLVLSMLELGSPAFKALLSGAGMLPLSLFAIAATLRTATDRTHTPERRRGWLLLSLALSAYVAGDILWTIMESALGLPMADATYNITDLFYLAFYPLLILGLVRLPTARLERGVYLQFWLDLLIILCAAWMFVWYLVIGPATQGQTSLALQFWSAVYPVGDLVALAGVVVLLLRRPDPEARTSLALLMLGLVMLAVGNLVFAYLRLNQLYETGGPADVTWSIAYLLFALSAIRHRQGQPVQEGQEFNAGSGLLFEWLSLALPFLAMLLGFSLLTVAGPDVGGVRMEVMWVSGGLLTLLVVCRQTALMQQNARLAAEVTKQYDLLRVEQDKSERLLLNILPGPIADRLKQSETTIADNFAEVTVLFADIVGFTPLSMRYPPDELVRMLNEVFTAFDTLAEQHGLEKIKTIGDAYMAASGLPTPNAHHAAVAARLALDMHTAAAHLAAEWQVPLRLRIGLNTGPVVAGVIGRRKFIYDLWGDTVNTASRMESHGEAGRTHLTEATAQKLDGEFLLEDRGLITVKGKGELQTYFLVGRKQG